MNGFQKWVPKKSSKHRESLLSGLAVGEMCYFDDEFKPLYSRVYYHQRKYGKEFSYMKIKNGIVVKREA